MAQNPAPSFQVAPNVRYTPNGAHRNRAFRDKSQWQIRTREEVDCFSDAHARQWCQASSGWGVHVDAIGRPQQLGVSCTGYGLWFAKFVDKAQGGDWHGYPADYPRYANDRPPTTLLQVWRQLGLIDKRIMLKVRQGQLCNP